MLVVSSRPGATIPSSAESCSVATVCRTMWSRSRPPPRGPFGISADTRARTLEKRPASRAASVHDPMSLDMLAGRCPKTRMRSPEVGCARPGFARPRRRQRWPRTPRPSRPASPPCKPWNAESNRAVAASSVFARARDRANPAHATTFFLSHFEHHAHSAISPPGGEGARPPWLYGYVCRQCCHVVIEAAVHPARAFPSWCTPWWQSIHQACEVHNGLWPGQGRLVFCCVPLSEGWARPQPISSRPRPAHGRYRTA